ncbi:MAG: hypothetical protein HY051_04880 [Candidatus Aenigmarchaeota archaeon]|nr:hypothetical protein [Candidatus Aenigmarchaeota archaeon]
MKNETIAVEIPKKILQIAESQGIGKEKISELMKSFAILEVTALTSKMSEKDVKNLSDDMKASAWKKVKQKLKI